MLPFMTVFLLLLLSNNLVICVTHWKVTESGRIEAKDDSVYTLQRPFDLASFLKQDERVERLNDIKKLLSSKDIVNNRDSKSKISLF